MNQDELNDFATRYAAAWSSHNPDALAAFYSEGGSLQVNAGAPAVGRSAVRATAHGFMAAFPDMVVRMDSVMQTAGATRFHWIWTGTNTGPGGTGNAVRMLGYEDWAFGPDGLISQSLGHFDEAEYERQLREGVPRPRPVRGEAADYYFTYIDQVRDGDVLEQLTAQAAEAAAFLRSIPESRTLHRYESGKWSIREVLGHLSDCERLFAYRAFWFARGFDTPLPSFDQLTAAAAAVSDRRSWSDLVDEFESVRAASVSLFRGLTDDAWDRRGIASGNPFSVRSLAFIAVGHVTHHIAILRARYL